MSAAPRQTMADPSGSGENKTASDLATVFIVDDDPAVRGAISCLVESAGLRCQLFSSGLEFLDACGPSPSGCLILDVRMAGLSGLDLQDRLHARGIDLPTIIITGHGDIPIAVQAMKHGAMDFLERPFRNQALLDSSIMRWKKRQALLRRINARGNGSPLTITRMTSKMALTS